MTDEVVGISGGSGSGSGSVAGSVNGAAAAVSGGNGSLFVGKLAFDCRTRELEELFGKYGRITRCDIKRGFAFVEFEDPRDADDAIKYLDGTRFLGFNITVEKAKGEKRMSNQPDGTRNEDCFKCGRPGHYARQCRGGSGSSDVRRGGDDRRSYGSRRDDRDDRDSRYRGGSSRREYGRDDRDDRRRDRSVDRDRDDRRGGRVDRYDGRRRDVSPAPRRSRSRSPRRSMSRSPRN